MLEPTGMLSAAALPYPGLGSEIESGADAGTITDAQAGDVVIAYGGTLTDLNNGIISGFTTVANRISTHNWDPSTGYNVSGRVQYKILDGTETTIPGCPGIATWVQFRGDRPVTSVLVGQVEIRQQALFTRNYTATQQTSDRVLCIRSVGSAGYNCANANPTMSTGTTSNHYLNAYTEFMTTLDFAAGTATAAWGGGSAWQSPNFFVELICIG
jgi:hypothetical protein